MFPSSFIVLALTFRSTVYFELTLSMLKGGGPKLFFACRYPVVPALFINKTILSSLSDLSTVVINQLSINVNVSFWTLNYIPVIYMPIILPILQCLYYCSFPIGFEISKNESSNNILS